MVVDALGELVERKAKPSKRSEMRSNRLTESPEMGSKLSVLSSEKVSKAKAMPARRSMMLRVFSIWCGSAKGVAPPGCNPSVSF